MDIKNTVSAARILYDSIFVGKTEFAQIPFIPSKTVSCPLDGDGFFPGASPRAAGIDGERLLRYVRGVSDDPVADIHSLIVLSNGKCVFEASKEGYDTRLPHATFSFCKTLTALAVGFLCEEGKLKLSDKVCSFFPEYKTTPKTASLRVEHLLTMSTGIVFNEVNSVTEESFLRGFFSASVRFEPGTRFAYNSMNSYVLAALVTRISGISLSAYLEERLFQPMGINNFFWETTSEGIEKGGWGLYLSVRSMAKIGQLFLQDGMWEGKRLIPKKWLRLMTERHMSAHDEIGTDFDYGYHIWIHKADGGLLLNGMLGQNVWILPEKGLVVAITAGENCVFQDAISLILAQRLLGGAPHTPHDTFRAKHARAALARHFGEGGSFTARERTSEAKEAQRLLAPHLFGKYLPSKNNSGLLPLMTRLVQNSPTKGITALFLAQGPTKHSIKISFVEEDAIYTLVANERRFFTGSLTLREEEYRYAAAYSFGKDENRFPFFKLEIRFPELPNTRRMLFRLCDDGFSLSMDEHPGYLFIDRLLRIIPYSLGENNVIMIELSKQKLPRSYLMRKFKNAFSPHLHLTRTDENGTK